MMKDKNVKVEAVKGPSEAAIEESTKAWAKKCFTEEVPNKNNDEGYLQNSIDRGEEETFNC
jgi:hypothetical protein